MSDADLCFFWKGEREREREIRDRSTTYLTVLLFFERQTMTTICFPKEVKGWQELTG